MLRNSLFLTSLARNPRWRDHYHVTINPPSPLAFRDCQVRLTTIKLQPPGKLTTTTTLEGRVYMVRPRFCPFSNCIDYSLVIERKLRNMEEHSILASPRLPQSRFDARNSFITWRNTLSWPHHLSLSPVSMPETPSFTSTSTQDPFLPLCFNARSLLHLARLPPF